MPFLTGFLVENVARDSCRIGPLPDRCPLSGRGCTVPFHGGSAAHFSTVHPPARERAVLVWQVVARW